MRGGRSAPKAAICIIKSGFGLHASRSIRVFIELNCSKGSSRRAGGIMTVDLNGQVALVTGAARNIGKAIADVFAQNGAHVVYADILIKEAQRAAAAYPACRVVMQSHLPVCVSSYHFGSGSHRYSSPNISQLIRSGDCAKKIACIPSRISEKFIIN